MTEVPDFYLLLVKDGSVVSIDCESLTLPIEAVNFLIGIVEEIVTWEVQMQTIHFGSYRGPDYFLVLVRVHKMPIGLREAVEQIDENVVIVAEHAVDQRIRKSEDWS